MRVLRSHLARALGDKSPAVRAATITALGAVDLTPEILQLVSKIKNDSNSTVRFRLCELFGTAKSIKTRSLTKIYLKDKNKLVSLLAKMFNLYLTREIADEKIRKELEKAADKDI